MSHVPSDASDFGLEIPDAPKLEVVRKDPAPKDSEICPSQLTPDTAEISDLNQNVWTYNGQHIVSVPRRSNVTPVTMSSFSCRHSVPPKQNSRFPIYFGIENPEKCLCCEKIKGKPTLQLKNKKLIDLYTAPIPVKKFLFYRNQTGSTSTFESVAFPGWFIASSGKGQPLFLTSNLGGAHNTAFIYKHRY
ncbi:interleukin-36 gamma-like [Suncus etruscus]|uniref:interleukin-36 gamma-like n=1 Tax=Suncus etruscus TaxID=109475 RepID=UPI002110CBB1|nr:interleukin-36 gamma-like [Suncus etruscus]